VVDSIRSETISEYRQLGRSSGAHPSSQLKSQPSIGAACASAVSSSNDVAIHKCSHGPIPRRSAPLSGAEAANG